MSSSSVGRFRFIKPEGNQRVYNFGSVLDVLSEGGKNADYWNWTNFLLDCFSRGIGIVQAG